MKDLRHSIDRTHDALAQAGPQRTEGIAVPRADIYETPDTYLVQIDLPGASRSGVTVTLESNSLTVRAAVEALHSDPAAVRHREIRTAGYERSFGLGEGIDRNTVDATFDQGVLTLKLYKSEELKPRHITIH